jgi:hypothetical protein
MKSYLPKWVIVLGTFILGMVIMHEIDYHPALRKQVIHHGWLGLGLAVLFVACIVSITLAHSKHKSHYYFVPVAIASTAALAVWLTLEAPHMKWAAILAVVGVVVGTLLVTLVIHALDKGNRVAMGEGWRESRGKWFGKAPSPAPSSTYLSAPSAPTTV